MTNQYDRFDVVNRESVVSAGNIKLAAYRVRNPENPEQLSNLQFHMTVGDTVLAVMSENAAKLFALFVNQTINQSKEQNNLKGNDDARQQHDATT